MRFIQPNCSNARVTIYELLKRRGEGGGGASDLRPTGGAIVTHHGPMTGGRTCDRRGCLKKEDKYPLDRALKNRTVRPKAGRMAALSNAPFHILSNGNGVATREK